MTQKQTLQFIELEIKETKRKTKIEISIGRRLALYVCECCGNYRVKSF